MSTPLPKPSAMTRLLWTSVLLGALTVTGKCMTICSRTESLYLDMLGSREHLPGHVVVALQWQRLLWAMAPYAMVGVAALIGWIWMTKSTRAMRAVVLILLMLLLAQGIASVLVSASHVPEVMRLLDGAASR